MNSPLNENWSCQLSTGIVSMPETSHSISIGFAVQGHKLKWKTVFWHSSDNIHVRSTAQLSTSHLLFSKTDFKRFLLEKAFLLIISAFYFMLEKHTNNNGKGLVLLQFLLPQLSCPSLHLLRSPGQFCCVTGNFMSRESELQDFIPMQGKIISHGVLKSWIRIQKWSPSTLARSPSTTVWDGRDVKRGMSENADWNPYRLSPVSLRQGSFQQSHF